MIDGLDLDMESNIIQVIPAHSDMWAVFFCEADDTHPNEVIKEKINFLCLDKNGYLTPMVFDEESKSFISIDEDKTVMGVYVSGGNNKRLIDCIRSNGIEFTDIYAIKEEWMS